MSRNSLPNLSAAQSGALWPMLADATAAAVREERCYDTAADKRTWRKLHLKEKCGIDSLSDIPRSGPLFARVMAELQIVARNGIDWIIKADPATSTLLFHVLEFLRAWSIEESYACGIAKNAFRFSTLPHLGQLRQDQLNTLVKILHAQAPRIARAAHGAGPQPHGAAADGAGMTGKENSPF